MRHPGPFFLLSFLLSALLFFIYPPALPLFEKEIIPTHLKILLSLEGHLNSLGDEQILHLIRSDRPMKPLNNRRLCFILPADLDEIIQGPPPASTTAPRDRRRRRRRDIFSKSNYNKQLGRWLAAFFRRLVSRSWRSATKYCCHKYPIIFEKETDHREEFHDTDGVFLPSYQQYHQYVMNINGTGTGGKHLVLSRRHNQPRIFTYSELYIASNGFDDKELLGAGGFGRVYRALLPSDGTLVAVKCVAAAADADAAEKSFLAELAAVAQLRHRNLVSLRGWCFHQHQLLLVYDYMPNRSLDRLLFLQVRNKNITNLNHRHDGGHDLNGSSAPPAPPPPPTLSWDRRRKIISGLAAALFYLHDQLDTQIIHRDVKSSNVMLDADFNARLGDFGLARWLHHAVVHSDFSQEYQATSFVNMISRPQLLLSSSVVPAAAAAADDDSDKKLGHDRELVHSKSNHCLDAQFRLTQTSRIGGTIGYLPPESFNAATADSRSTAAAKSDVFSFGIVVLEVISGRRAVDLSYPDDQIVLLDWVRHLSDEGKSLQAVDPGLPDGSYALSDMNHILHLALLCTLHDPQSRPSMRWVNQILSCDFTVHLPQLPSFRSHPRYISYSDSSISTTTTTTTTTSAATTADATSTSTTTLAASTTAYESATGATVFLTADNDIQSGGNNYSSDQKKQRISRLHGGATAASISVDTPREIPYGEIVAATDNFSESHVVAEMDFGTAYHAFLNNGLRVLVKRLGMKTCPALRARFSDELCNLGSLRHRNLVQLRGWCTQQGEMLVVYDYVAPQRSLTHHLLLFNTIHGRRRRRRDTTTIISSTKNFYFLRWSHRYNIVKSLASAILYLHEEWEEQVIHRSITSSSVFLDDDMNPRLGSFALAEFLTRNADGNHHVSNTTTTSSARGIFGYMSPEYMESGGAATTMADVYSFGVVVLEIVTGRKAVDFREPQVLLVHKVHEFETEKRPLIELVDSVLENDYDRDELVRLVELGLACSRTDPNLRPTMRQIVSVLDGKNDCLHRTKPESLKEEKMEDWEQRNASSLALIKRIQALGID